MFGQMMDAIDDDYLRYVMHVQVVAEPAPEPDLAQRQLPGGRRPRRRGRASWRRSRASVTAADVAAAGATVCPPGSTWAAWHVDGAPASPRHLADGDTQAPLVKAPSEKLGRNEPCWCGSGKKFKLCHGAA